MSHTERHPLAGQTVTVKTAKPLFGQAETTVQFRIEDWWDRVSGGSWMDAEGNPAALSYAVRSAVCRLPVNNEVVYGKAGHFGHLVHVSEIVGDAA